MTAAGGAALVTQFIVQHSDRLPETNLSSWIGPTPAPIAGVAYVIDGDTIEIHGQRIRFNGIDAPESAQQCDDAKGFRYQCGTKAAAALDAFLAASKPVRCTFVSWDRHGRYVGECARSDGANVAAWVVEHGHALDWPRYSHGAYAGQQAKAEAGKVGIWAGTFQAPWDWRDDHRSAGGEEPSSIVSLLGSPRACKIKGNVSAPRHYVNRPLFSAWSRAIHSATSIRETFTSSMTPR
ncbi:thermonuclease family protein [Mesorhizobium sp.]|uniref:thermonuclease family protein n=1 Tax=Mesorhizobium sp. TaxID=1871066 RepID=UPI00257EC284|nr:thermonuclease family protein [Mesorhizobium sp.]